MKLDASFLDNRKKAVDAARLFDSILEDRITYIVICICDAFKLKFFGWEYPEDHEGEVNTFDESVDSDSVRIQMYYNYDLTKAPIIVRGGEEWILDQIPLDWLTTDFEEELIQGRDLYIKKMEDKKIKDKIDLKDKKNKDKQLLKQIKAKLSPEEIKVLKLK